MPGGQHGGYNRRMAIQLSGKPIIITGASAGIGRATAIACARAGMPVVVAARRVGKIEELVREIRHDGGRAESVVCDVANPDDCERAVAVCLETFGSVYSVFANAGYGMEDHAHGCGERLRHIFETNFFGTMNSIRPAIPFMQRQGAGHVLICSSCVARFALPYYGAYAATKSAQHLMGRAMNLELRPFGVRVSTVHPIGTKTEFGDVVRAKSEVREDLIAKHTPALFMQTPERVARAVVKCLRRPRPEVWTSHFVRISMAFCAAFPRLADISVRGMVRETDLPVTPTCEPVLSTREPAQESPAAPRGI